MVLTAENAKDIIRSSKHILVKNRSIVRHMMAKSPEYRMREEGGVGVILSDYKIYLAIVDGKLKLHRLYEGSKPAVKEETGFHFDEFQTLEIKKFLNELHREFKLKKHNIHCVIDNYEDLKNVIKAQLESEDDMQISLFGDGAYVVTDDESFYAMMVLKQ